MSIFGFSRQIQRLTRSNFRLITRSILSSSYPCQEEWKKRLEEPAFSGITPDEFFYQVNERIKAKLPIEPIDVDIFTNVIKEQINLDEGVYFLTLLRENRRTVFTLESTHHAVCRAFLSFDCGDKLLEILQDKKKYGVFPDNFAFNLIMDYYLEKSDFLSSVKVAHLYMLQEDFTNEIGNILSLYSVYNCLTDPEKKQQLCLPNEKVETESTEEKQGGGEDDEPEYIRVPYLRNPSFDDHFDIKDPLLLSGKTLYLIGMQNDDIIGRTSQLVGLAYWQKWQKAHELLDKFLSEPNKLLAKGVIELVSSAVESLPEPDDQATSLLEKLKSNEKLASNDDIMDLVKKRLGDIKNLEQKDVEEMKKLFSKWKEDRAKAINQQLENYMREEKIKEIKKLKKELAERERKLYFFENFNRVEMDYQKAAKKLAELKAAEVEEEYFPPQMAKSHNQPK